MDDPTTVITAEFDELATASARRHDTVVDGMIRSHGRQMPGLGEIDVWRPCNGRHSRMGGSIWLRFSDGRPNVNVPAITCDRCGAKFATPTVPTHGDEAPAHAARMSEVAWAEDAIRNVGELLGFEPWSAWTMAANDSPSSLRRMANTESRLAHGLRTLANACTERSANAHAAATIRALLDFTVPGAEHPLFTEGGMYDLLGKDDARTVLAVMGPFDDGAEQSPTLRGTETEHGALVLLAKVAEAVGVEVDVTISSIVEGALADVGVLVEYDDVDGLFDEAARCICVQLADVLTYKSVKRRVRETTVEIRKMFAGERLSVFEREGFAERLGLDANDAARLGEILASLARPADKR